ERVGRARACGMRARSELIHLIAVNWTAALTRTWSTPHRIVMNFTRLSAHHCRRFISPRSLGGPPCACGQISQTISRRINPTVAGAGLIGVGIAAALIRGAGKGDLYQVRVDDRGGRE